jgi:very-short-patch-repair endonuclease
VVELDGCQHQDQLAYDVWRTRHLEGLGLKALRLESAQIFNGDLEGVCDDILYACERVGAKLSGQGAPQGACEVATLSCV